MTNRIIRDIRIYELKPENYIGHFDGTVGNVFNNTSDSKHIGERIARKLNELGLITGTFDHVYVYLSPTLPENAMKVQEKELDERLKSVHYGIKPSVFNSLSESNKDRWTKEIAFKALYLLFQNDTIKMKIISEVEALMNKYNKEIEIFYKAKETKSCKVELRYQIKPNGNSSRMNIRYLNKKEGVNKHCSIDLLNHEDIYSLVDTITVKDDVIVLSPKKSKIADLILEKYLTPLKIEIAKLEY
jgi:hypothetical protein